MGSFSIGSNWMESEEDELQQQHTTENSEYVKLFCALWNKEILEQKGPYPKFTVAFTLIGYLIVFLVQIVIVCGFGTNWYLYSFIPLAISTFAFLIISICELRIPKENRSHKKVILTLQAIIAVIGIYGVAAMLIHKTPFDNMIVFLSVATPISFISLFPTVQTKLSENEIQSQAEDTNLREFVQQSSLARNAQSTHYRDYGAIYRSFFKKQDKIQQIAQQKKSLLQKALWVSFVSTVTMIDLFSDLYYGLQIQIKIANNNTLLRVIGSFILLACLIDILIVVFTILKPQNVNYKLHIIALCLEICSFVGTAQSLYILLRKNDDELTSAVRDGIKFAIFSLITTTAATIIHAFYVVDFYSQKYAREFIQRM
eukprot:TRINITY_DN5630_c1_g2_i1.p1 TRINITY_DN5630_c1_g2~~TRINITY_DN5630_c1_g2_i1.p1  ORF type:complete len:371 (+),score=-0.38 TRINITY_DN5630_c1_g2_i1:388-1500(+)